MLLFYINEPSIIIGRNQNTVEEVNQRYVEENGIHVVRRMSGGGAVYHDLGNFSFCFIQDENGIARNFSAFTRPVIECLHKMGATGADGSIFVLDAGLKYPENEQLGVDVVIPNMDYLFENSDRIEGVFLTHEHADAIGALPYLLAEAKVPVFGSELTIELAKLFVKGNDTVKKFNDFHVIDEDTEIDFGGTVVSFFRTTRSIPESLGIVLKIIDNHISAIFQHSHCI